MSGTQRASGIVDWLARGARHFSLRDVGAVTFPPSIARKILQFSRREHHGKVAGDDPAARDPEFVGFIVDFFRALGEHYFRWDVRGIENVPATGPALLVGNHNGGIVITDSFLTIVAVWDRFGPHRAVHGLAHDIAFDDPTLGRYAVRFGALRAGHASAHRGLAAGNLVLVYPGSDMDSFRPWRERHRVELGQRKGFVRLALRAGVPIVPTVSAGTHEQFVVLTRGEELARRFGLKKFLRAEVFPIVLALPWGLSSGFLPYLPLPAQTTIAFGEPIRWSGLTAADADDPAVVDRCYEEVRARMQALLDEISAGRRPLLGARRPAPQ